MPGDSTSSDTEQLAPGNVLLHGETLFIVEKFRGGSVDVGQLGNREVKPSRMFDVGEECPAPGCSGEVLEDGPGQRTCSEGCLVWSLNHRTDGEDCPSINCEDGTVIDKHERGDKYSVKCTECERFAFGPEYWRESWRSHSRENAIRSLHTESERDIDE